MKRFTETQKWEDPWYRKLPVEMKLLWQWICDRCDAAGVIEPDMELASFQIGYQYPTDTLCGFGDRVTEIATGKWLIVKFIEFQYGQLSRDCKAHRPVFMSLQKHSVEVDLKGYPMGINTHKDQSTDQDKDKEKEKDKSDDRSNRKRYADHSEVVSYAKSQPFQISEECMDAFFDRMEEIGWTDDRGLPLADWRARFRRYATNWANNANGRKAVPK